MGRKKKYLTEEEKLEDLIKFYKECLSGKNDRLLQEGTNFDRIVRDRDEYINEEEYEEIDIGIEEIHRHVGNLNQAVQNGRTAGAAAGMQQHFFLAVGRGQYRAFKRRFGMVGHDVCVLVPMIRRYFNKPPCHQEARRWFL